MNEKEIRPEYRELARALVAEFGLYVLDLEAVWGMDGDQPRFMIGPDGQRSMLGLVDGQLWAWTTRHGHDVAGPVKEGRIEGDHCVLSPLADPGLN
jgi:hypothetical protein